MIIKKVFFGVMLVIAIAASGGGGRDHEVLGVDSTKLCFKEGELIKYRLHLGVLSAGEAELRVLDKVSSFHGKPCFNIEIRGQTTGLADLLYKVDDIWGTYLDTSNILPLRSYRYIKEGRYRKNEIVDYDHNTDSVVVHKLNKKDRKLERKVPMAVHHRSQGLVSGYYHLRSLNLRQSNPGDTICMNAFFDDEIYRFEVVFLGREEINTKIGRFKTLVFSPVMEKNRLFNSKDAVKVWITDDENKIPLKIRASIFVGALEADITEVKNVRGKLNPIRK